MVEVGTLARAALAGVLAAVIGVPGGIGVAGGAVSPDAAVTQALGVEAGPSVLLHDPKWLDDPATGSTEFLTGTPDGRYLAYLTSDATVIGPRGSLTGAAVVVRDTVTDTIEVEWSTPPNNFGVTTPTGVELSADGRWMTLNGRLGLDTQRPDGAFAQTYLLDRWNDTARLVSRRADGTAGSAGGATTVGVDDSGRYVLFSSSGTDLAGAWSGFGFPQLYRWDRLTDTMIQVSAGSGGTGNGEASRAQFSADGQVVLFESSATNLVTTGPGANQPGTFVADLAAGTLVAITTPGTQNIGSTTEMALSADGSRVAFTTSRTDMGFSGPGAQLLAWSRSTGAFELVSPSATSATAGSNSPAWLGGISADGSVVAFRSTATDLVPGGTDNNGQYDAFVRDLTANTTRLLSRSADSPTTAASDGGVDRVRLSRDGTFVTWEWSAIDTPAGAPANDEIEVAGAELSTGNTAWLRKAPVVPVIVPIYDNEWVSNGGKVGVIEASTGPILARIAPDPLEAAGRFVPLLPARLLDTRDGTGDERIARGIGLDRPEELHLQVVGRGGVPVRDVTAVVLNVTNLGAPGTGFISVRPSRRQPLPEPFCASPILHSCTRPAGSLQTSNLNIDRPGRVIANHVTVAVGPGGRVSLASTAGGHLVVDVLGYYTPSGAIAAGRLVGQSPSRILDTRKGLGAPNAALGAGGIVRLQVAGRGGVPSTGAAAVVMNVTVAGATNAGFVTAWPAGVTRPLASNLNVERPGQVRPNLVTVPLGSGGAVDLLLSGGGHLAADVLGWYTDSSGTASTSGRFVPVDPVRFLDTRSAALGGPEKPAARSTIARSPATAGLPADAAAVIANLTATHASASGYVTAFPAGTAVPLASNVNVEFAGQTIPNQALLRPGVGGAVSFYTSGGTHLLADAAGWWTN